MAEVVLKEHLQVDVEPGLSQQAALLARLLLFDVDKCRDEVPLLESFYQHIWCDERVQGPREADVLPQPEVVVEAVQVACLYRQVQLRMEQQ